LLSEGTWYKALRTVAQIALLLQAVPVASLALLLQTANAQAAPVDASWYKELLINVKSVEPARAPPTLMAAAVVQQTVFVQPVTILRIVQPMKLVLLPLISNALNVPVPIISPAVQAVWLAVRPALLVRPAQALVPPQGPQTTAALLAAHRALLVSTGSPALARLLPTIRALVVLLPVAPTGTERAAARRAASATTAAGTVPLLPAQAATSPSAQGQVFQTRLLAFVNRENTRALLPAAQHAGRPAVQTNTGAGAAPVQAPPIMVASIVPSPLAPAAPSTSVQGRA